MIDKYEVVTLCGSTKFKDDFIKAQEELTLQGYIVISVGLFGHADNKYKKESNLVNTSKVNSLGKSKMLSKISLV